MYRGNAFVAMLSSLLAPLSVIYTNAVTVATKAKRRAGCDGSIIAITYLIKQEFGVDIEFKNGLSGSRRYIRKRGESLQGVAIGHWYIYGRTESPNGLYDYIVTAPNTDSETKQRIKSVIALYNSAGFVFDVI